MAWTRQGPERYPLARKSLLYLAGYLTLLGVALLAWPLRTLDALGATGAYEPYFPRVSGMFLLGLAMITGALIVKRLDVLYVGVVGVRAFFCLAFLVFYLMSRDPVFLVFFGLVFVGVLSSTLCLFFDRRRERRARS